jgi:hypothetical protein
LKAFTLGRLSVRLNTPLLNSASKIFACGMLPPGGIYILGCKKTA